VPKCHALKTNTWPGDNASCALNLGSGYKWVVISTSWLLQQRGWRPSYPLDSKSGGQEYHLCPVGNRNLLTNMRVEDPYMLVTGHNVMTKSCVITIACFPLIRHGLHRKWRLQQIFVAARRSLLSCYLATICGCIDPQTQGSNNSCSAPCIRCGGNAFTEPLHSNEKRKTIYQVCA
jgi:hypothetical protein